MTGGNMLVGHDDYDDDDNDDEVKIPLRKAALQTSSLSCSLANKGMNFQLSFKKDEGKIPPNIV